MEVVNAIIKDYENLSESVKEAIKIQNYLDTTTIAKFSIKSARQQFRQRSVHNITVIVILTNYMELTHMLQIMVQDNVTKSHNNYFKKYKSVYESEMKLDHQDINMSVLGCQLRLVVKLCIALKLELRRPLRMLKNKTHALRKITFRINCGNQLNNTKQILDKFILGYLNYEDIFETLRPEGYEIDMSDNSIAFYKTILNQDMWRQWLKPSNLKGQVELGFL